MHLLSLPVRMPAPGAVALLALAGCGQAAAPGGQSATRFNAMLQDALEDLLAEAGVR